MPVTPEEIAALIESPWRDGIVRWEELPKDPVQRVTLARKVFGADAARVVLELSELRHRAEKKFVCAEAMFFDRESLEQSSSQAIARLRAEAFSGCESVADLTCGIGSDACALALTVARVTASDISAARVRMSAWNSRALPASYGDPGAVDRIVYQVGPAERFPRAEGYFLDPSRRAGGRKSRHLRDLSPPVELARELLKASGCVGMKLSAATPDEELLSLGGSVDFIASGGVCREAFVRMGRLALPYRRALFPKRGAGRLRADMPGADGWEEISARPGTPAPVVCPPLKYLLEPDAAIIRAGLIPELCAKIGAALLDPASPYLTSDHPCPGSFAASYQILRAMPFSVKAVRACLREMEAGQVEVKKRALEVDVDDLRKRLKGPWPGHAVVALTRLAARPWAFICRACDPAEEEP